MPLKCDSEKTYFAKTRLYFPKTSSITAACKEACKKLYNEDDYDSWPTKLVNCDPYLPNPFGDRDVNC